MSENSVDKELERLRIKVRHLENQHEVVKLQYDKTTDEYLKILDDVSKTNKQLLNEITQRKKAEEQIKTSLAEKEVLLKEIHHRVKNNMQVISSLLQLQADRIHDEYYHAIFQEGIDRIQAMSLIHSLLYQTENLSCIDFSDYIPKLCNYLFSLYRTESNTVRISTDITDVSLKLDIAIPCGLIVNELISNSLKHAFPNNRDGEITLSMKESGEHIVLLRVSDNGIGMPDSLDWRNTDTLGLMLVSGLVERQLLGTIELRSSAGTEFIISFNSG